MADNYNNVYTSVNGENNWEYVTQIPIATHVYDAACSLVHRKIYFVGENSVGPSPLFILGGIQ